MEKEIVRMAEAKAVTVPNKLVSEGLGSCVAVCLLDKEHRVGGMAHVVLPTKEKSNGSKKYADNLLKDLVEKIRKQGGREENLKAKVFGGAQLFEFSSDIGEQNVKSVHKFLKEKNIPVVSEDIGGEKGRSIEFDLETGNAEVKKCFESEKVY